MASFAVFAIFRNCSWARGWGRILPLIDQGRIGQILSSRPTDRRAIIEEAAGITEFKTKKRLAEARLEEAKQTWRGSTTSS